MMAGSRRTLSPWLMMVIPTSEHLKAEHLFGLVVAVALAIGLTGRGALEIGSWLDLPKWYIAMHVGFFVVALGVFRNYRGLTGIVLKVTVAVVLANLVAISLWVNHYRDQLF